MTTPGRWRSRARQAAYCDSRVRPADGAARTYKAYVVQGSPAATGGPVNPLVSSDPITVTNTGIDPTIGDDTQPRIDAVTVPALDIYQNYPYARIAVDLNKDSFSPFYVGVLARQARWSATATLQYALYNTCEMDGYLVAGESRPPTPPT